MQFKLIPDRREQIHPYLLREMTIDRPNQVWAADITYIPMRRGFVYLVAVLDWHSRKVLSWRLSNTLTTDSYLDAVREAIVRQGILVPQRKPATPRKYCADPGGRR